MNSADVNSGQPHGKCLGTKKLRKREKGDVASGSDDVAAYRWLVKMTWTLTKLMTG